MSETQSRKQAQIANREEAILKLAAEIVSKSGVDDLTMERVLERVEFSKGTLYNHFLNREDLLVALHAQCYRAHLTFFQRGALFKGRSRERFLATATGHDIMVRLDRRPFRFALTESVLSSASDRWRAAFTDAQRETFGIFTGIMRDAISSGDIASTASPDFVVTSAWSMSFGADELRECGQIFRGLPDLEFMRSRDGMVATLLDGHGWRPLSTEHDYVETKERIFAEVYHDEARKLGWL